MNPTPYEPSPYGARMGRWDAPLEPDRYRLHLLRIRLDSGGYDPGGAYWGSPNNLWACGHPAPDSEHGRWFYVRADSRDEAKAIIREEWGDGARFYR